MRWHGFIQFNDRVHLLLQQLLVIAKVEASKRLMAKTDGAIGMQGDGQQPAVEAVLLLKQ